MKVVVLTSETPANIWLVNQILARFDVVGLVIERRPLAITRREKFSRRRQMIRRYGVGRTVNKLLYNWMRAHSRADSAVLAADAPSYTVATGRDARSVPTTIVQGINDVECARFIKELAPDVLAVCGTTLIRPEVFSLAPKGAVNIHTGITPEYRSADPIFWALYRGEPDKVGVTIHFIDSGIDTGPILHQDTVPVYADDSLESIYVRCIRRGGELYLLALSEIESGSVRPISRSGAGGHAYRSIDLGVIEYVRFRFRFRRMARDLPTRQADAY